MPTSVAGVDWAALEHAYGPAADLPQWLEKVAHARGRLFGDAMGELYSRVLHQGSIYSASPFAVEAIAEMVRNPNPPEERRGALLAMLDDFAASARKSIADGRFIPCHSGGEPEHGNAIRQILNDSRPLFEGLLGDKNAETRAHAASLVCAFDDAPSTAVARLERMYGAEQDKDVRRGILLALVRCCCDRDFMRRAIRSETDAGNRLWLFVAAVRGTEASDEDLDGLSSNFAAANQGLNLSEAWAETEYFEALAPLSVDRRRQALLRLLGMQAEPCVARAAAERLLREVFHDERYGWGQTSSQWERTDGKQPLGGGGLGKMAFRAIGMLLVAKLFPFYFRWKIRRMANRKRPDGIARINYWGVKGSEPDIPAPLTTEQAQLLRAIADEHKLWTFRTNLWSMFGLPESAESLRAFIASHSG